MSDLSKVSPDTLIILVTLFTVLISQNFSLDQTNVVGNVFAQIGASLLTKAAQGQALQSQEELKKQIDDMEQQLCKLKKQMF